MIIFGTRLFGKCDSIDGVGHVATRFFHINFVPLIPLGGWFVLEGSDDRGVDISVRGKSILAAWTRAGTFFGGVLMLVFGLGEGSTLMSVFGALSLALFVASYWLFASMSDERRIQLMADTGLLAVLLEQHREEQLVQQSAAAYEPAGEQPAVAYGGYQPSAAGQAAYDEPVPFAEYTTAPQPR